MNHQAPRLRFELCLTLATVFITVICSSLYLARTARTMHVELLRDHVWAIAQIALFVVIVLSLLYGNLLYQLTRIGYLWRRYRHRPPGSASLRAWIANREAPALTILVPSYKEDLSTIQQTMLSAALQEYPRRRVVLLIDNPPAPADADDLDLLNATRGIVAELQRLLDGPAGQMEAELAAFEERAADSSIAMSGELARLTRLHQKATAWYREQARRSPAGNHTDALFVEMTFRRRERDHRRQAVRLLRERVQRHRPAVEQLRREYRMLAAEFRVELDSFERKQFANLSHAANKAANLNSYIGLLGASWRIVERDGERCLEPAGGSDADLVVPAAGYVITLDADSMLAHDYAIRLVHIMEQPGNERVGVVQTPYSAVPAAPGVLERIAGATTDMQYLIHQGFTHYGATFWVGANALLRMAALADICTVTEERGHEIRKYVQDRTVIEDTESTIDLARNGWQLLNYPERLAYSATPPDFGALVVQRRRWANGGLLILPKLIGYMAKGSGAGEAPRLPGRLREGFFRFHYLASIGAVNIGLLILLFYPFTPSAFNWWLPLAAAPYFLLYWRDLLLHDYKIGDILRVYAFNLLLVPVNVSGVIKSLQQAVTGEQIPFGRTPKTAGRTAAPAWAILAVYALLAYTLFGGIWDLAAGRWLHAAFSLLNAAAFLYAAAVFIGPRAGLEDVRRQLQLPRPRRRRRELPESRRPR